ncbi:MAG: hypothetical protein HY452_02420 [Parcubacteria group bacterium]|nr:hypothetical protein [Parcubacteria group bacterium]
METILSIVVGVLVLAAITTLIKVNLLPKGSGIVNDPVALTQVRPGWQVMFAGDWYDCQIVGDNGHVGKLVRLTDKRTHSRIISRPLGAIRQVV